MNKLFSFLIFLLTLFVVTCGVSSATDDWVEKGLELAGSQKYDEAIEAFTKALEADPSRAEAYNHRGAAWFLKGNPNRAIEDYTDAIQINPQYADAYNNRGAAWYQVGNFNRAIADYTMALKDVTTYLEAESAKAPDGKPRYRDIAPIYANVYINRGSSWYQIGNFDRAIADYTIALEIKPELEHAYINRGMAWYHKRDFRLALADYKKALEISPDSAYAHNQLAWMLAVCPDGRYRDGQRAVQLAERAVKLEPGANSLDTLAAALAEAGRFKEAVQTQERVVALRNKEGSGMKLSVSVERLRSYKAKKPWRSEPTVSKTTATILSRIETVQVPMGNIRLKPSVNAPIVATVKAGSELRVVHQKDRWYIVELPDQRTGWAHQNLFTAKPGRAQLKGTTQESEITSPPPVTTGEPNREGGTQLTVRVSVANVRSAPSVHSEIKYRLKKGTVVTVKSTEQNWYLVLFGEGESGWAHRSLFRKSESP